MSDYEKYVRQQKNVYANSKPIKDWRKQMKNPKSNLQLLEIVKNFDNNTGVAYDLGCGEGYHTEDLRRFGYEAYGVELSEKRVDDGIKMGRNYIEVGDVHNLPWKDNTASLVFMHEVLEHCAYPDKVLGEIKRVLKHGGQFVISMPCEGHWKKPQKDMTQHNLNAKDNHVWKPTVQMVDDTFAKFFEGYAILLYNLDSVSFIARWTGKGQKINFRPHAFIVGDK